MGPTRQASWSDLSNCGLRVQRDQPKQACRGRACAWKSEGRRFVFSHIVTTSASKSRRRRATGV